MLVYQQYADIEKVDYTLYGEQMVKVGALHLLDVLNAYLFLFNDIVYLLECLHEYFYHNFQKFVVFLFEAELLFFILAPNVKLSQYVMSDKQQRLKYFLIPVDFLLRASFMSLSFLAVCFLLMRKFFFTVIVTQESKMQHFQAFKTEVGFKPACRSA